MDYDIEADWMLLPTCNFRCTYCYVSAAGRGAKPTQFGTPAEWTDAFNATARTWLIHLTGGEPTMYPDFVDLCERLSERHYLSVNSNLSHRAVEAFAERIDPQRVHFINAALHDNERQPERDRQAFIQRVHTLRQRGFHVLVSQVMTPDVLGRFSELARHFQSREVILIPKVMRGPYQGKSYPGAYSAVEKHQILQYLTAAREDYAAVIARMQEPATINMFLDDRFLHGIPSYHGRLCGAGHRFVRIDSDGTVFRCGAGKRCGNLLRRRVRLAKGPKHCDTSYCPYFCEKYTSPQYLTARPGGR